LFFFLPQNDPLGPPNFEQVFKPLKVTTAYLEKYQLESNHQILAEEKHLKLYQEIVDLFPVEYLPGGATLNTMRIAKVSLFITHSS
jgi:hypothetical protein